MLNQTDCPDCDRGNGHGGRLRPKVHFHLVVGDYTIQEVAGIAYLDTPSASYQFNAGLGDTDRALSTTPETLSQIIAHLQKFNGRTIFPTTFAQAVFAIEQRSQQPTPMMDWYQKLNQAFVAVGVVGFAIALTATVAVADGRSEVTEATQTVYQDGMTDEQVEEALQKVMPEFGFCADGKNRNSSICQPGADGDNG